jgi:uncharacterized protein YjdB
MKINPNKLLLICILFISLLTVLSCNKNEKLKIKITSISISPNKGKLNIGEERTIKVNIIPENATNKNITWTSNNEEIASVDNKGKIKANKSGIVNITATCSKESVRAIYELTICNNNIIKNKDIEVESITINETNENLNFGKTIKLEYTIIPELATNKSVIWTSNNKEIATVDKQAVVTGIAGGECIITARTEDGNKTSSCSIKVIESVKSIEILEPKEILIEGDYIFLKTNILPKSASNKRFKWKSEKEDIATINQNGKVHGVKAGDVLIKAITEDGNITNSYRLKVEEKNPHVTGINMPYSKGQLKEGENLRIIAYSEPLNAKNNKILWKSSDTTIASINKGVITGMKIGVVTITATTEEGEFSSEYTLTITTGYVLFKDNKFKQAIITTGADKDNDGNISKDEALKIKRLELKELGITNIFGLVDFRNLEFLDCSGNNIKSIDLLESRELINLNCSNCELTSIEVTSSTKLKNINCSNNKITTLNLSKCSQLENIDCSNNTISGFTIPALIFLEKIDCHTNNIPSLDVSGSSKLEILDCENNPIIDPILVYDKKYADLNFSKNFIYKEKK